MRTGIDDQETVVPLGVARDSAGMARALTTPGGGPTSRTSGARRSTTASSCWIVRGPIITEILEDTLSSEGIAMLLLEGHICSILGKRWWPRSAMIRGGGTTVAEIRDDPRRVDEFGGEDPRKIRESEV